ncbi:helix-turn-helix domain-containing protein [Henriciella aquimarina]|uniref:helix-turn-helix domain-containing protein n=1 Tax=Henriciella aquimarina TaxID=545261 RepID=UPI000A07BC83|nr:helix-turn-helix domain-containing protein [Henriciella aquimarina]
MRRPKYQNDEYIVRLAAGLTGYALRIPAETILSFNQREHRVARARQVTMYLSHVALGMSLARIASAMGRDRSTVAHGCHRIEDFRDDPDIDAWLDELEGRLRSAAMLEADAESIPAPIERLQLT